MAPVFSRIAEVSALLLALSSSVEGFWRLPCQARSGLARIDPMVNPGDVGSHAHAIHGGSNFGMSSGYNDLMKSNCTSCAVSQDHSAYWTPALYFQGADGKTELVKQVGGTLVYYLLYGKPKAFPAGFQMIAGDTNRRSFTLPVPDPPQSSWSGDQATQSALAQKAVGFNCLDYSKTPEGSLYRHFLPDKAYLDKNCKDGVRFELMFPSCWNGKDVSAPDHQSHMAYPSTVKDGTCPKGFETRLISLFFETIWDTGSYKGKNGRFIISNGDDSGYGYHGDFMTGWDTKFLQQAADTCTNDSGRVEDCPLFKPTLQSEATQGQCKFEMPAQLAKDDCSGPRQGLPGNVPLQVGPARASAVPIPGALKGPAGGAQPQGPPPPPPVSSATTTQQTLPYSSAAPLSSGAVFAAKFAKESPAAAALPPAMKKVEPNPVTSAPPAPSTTYASTSYSTNGASVYEIYIANTEVTVTVPVTKTEAAAAASQPSGDAAAAADQPAVPEGPAPPVEDSTQPYKKRHLHHHMAHHGQAGRMF